MAMAHEPESMVGQRMAALLPELLQALRRRTRRARRRRLAVAALVAAAPACWLAWLLNGPGAVPATPVAAPTWTVVRDDPGVLARCVVANTVLPGWFVSDDELQDLLRGAARPAGIVRVGGRVFVAAAAIDPWPGERP